MAGGSGVVGGMTMTGNINIKISCATMPHPHSDNLPLFEAGGCRVLRLQT
jgi:hypothetical protein